MRTWETFLHFQTSNPPTRRKNAIATEALAVNQPAPLDFRKPLHQILSRRRARRRKSLHRVRRSPGLTVAASSKPLSTEANDARNQPSTTRTHPRTSSNLTALRFASLIHYTWKITKLIHRYYEYTPTDWEEISDTKPFTDNKEPEHEISKIMVDEKCRLDNSLGEGYDDFAMLVENLLTELDKGNEGKLKKNEIRDALIHMTVGIRVPTFSESIDLLKNIIGKNGVGRDEQLGPSPFAQLLQKVLQDLADALAKNMEQLKIS